MPGSPHIGGKRLVPIGKLGNVTFRYVNKNKTKWASCEVGDEEKAKEPIYVMTGITSAGQPTYEAKKVEFVKLIEFSQPCADE